MRLIIVNEEAATPDYPLTMSSGGRPRSHSQETVLTAITEATVESVPSITYPGPPLNSPLSVSVAETQSVAGGLDGLNADTLADKLEHMPVPSTMTTPPASDRDHQGRACLCAHVRMRDLKSQLSKSRRGGQREVRC